MPEPLVVIGAGGFGRETVDVAEAMIDSEGQPRWNVLGVTDDDPSSQNLRRLEARDLTYLGTTDNWLTSDDDARFVVGIGGPVARRLIAERLEGAGRKPATLVHPSATFGRNVSVGEGSVICAGARVTTNVVIGRHVHVNLNATIGHDCMIGNFVSINPLGSVSGDVRLEDDVLIGVAGVVLNLLTVGRGAVVGGSACVVRDVTAGATVKGVPAR